MHLIRLAPLAALLLAGCATHVQRAPASAPKAVAVARVIPMGSPATCSIILQRGPAMFGRSHADAPVLFVDHQPIATLRMNERLCVEVIDGDHHITMRERRFTIPVGFSNSLPYKFPRAQPLVLEYGQSAQGNRVSNYFTESNAARVR